LQVSLSGDDTRLIDAKLACTTTNNLSAFVLTVIFNNVAGSGVKSSENGIAEITWKHFDPGEGFRLRLIYASKEFRSPKLDGAIFGVRSFQDTTPPPKGKITVGPLMTFAIWTILNLGAIIIYQVTRRYSVPTICFIMGWGVVVWVAVSPFFFSSSPC
jgi:hypothetical protein